MLLVLLLCVLFGADFIKDNNAVANILDGLNFFLVLSDHIVELLVCLLASEHTSDYETCNTANDHQSRALLLQSLTSLNRKASNLRFETHSLYPPKEYNVGL